MDSETKCKITKAINKHRPMSRGLCLSCKGGRLLCNRPSCPLLMKIDIQNPFQKDFSTEMFGPSPSIFVGWGGYPNLSVGQMTSYKPETASISDDPGGWYGLGFDDIIAHRSSLVRSRKKEHVKAGGGFIQDMQEIALSVRPIDVESRYRKKPSFGIEFNPISQPMGPQADLEKMRIIDNPVIPRKVDYIVNDDLRSVNQLKMLYGRDFDVYYLSGILSSGVLGKKADKKMVPTRWSITAVDDTLGKLMINDIKYFDFVNEFQVYENTYLGNHFEIVLMPGNWEFELFEAWSPNTLWTGGETEPVIQVEHERYEGRTKYAFNEGGGYYAGRFAVVEYLKNFRRQARVVVFREIYDDYIVPVGVWEVRENIRNALKKKPAKFNTMKEALKDVESRLTIPLKNYLDKSQIMTQKRITDFS